MAGLLLVLEADKEQVTVIIKPFGTQMKSSSWTVEAGFSKKSRKTAREVSIISDGLRYLVDVVRRIRAVAVKCGLAKFFAVATVRRGVSGNEVGALRHKHRVGEIKRQRESEKKRRIDR